DLPAFSSAPVFSPIAAPILMPAAASGPPKWVWPLVGVGGLAVVAIVVLGVLLLNKKPEQVAIAPVAVPVAAPVAAPPVAAVAAAGTTAPVAAAGAAPAAGTAVAAAEHGGKGPHAGGKAGKGGAAEHPGGKAGAKNDVPVAASAPKPEPASTPKTKKGGDELDALLNGASPDKPAKHAAAESSSNDDNLPEQLNKAQIVGGMHALAGGVHDCFSKFNAPGMVSIALTIVKSGRVSSSSATGSFAGTPTGDCVARAVKGGSFPAFKGAPQSITYPFVLK
ncbi:MAG: hypothetical protein ABI321_15000, partial [Polyangia bacterium]